MTNQIITIGRQFGSGGREIGKLVSEKLDIPFYDKELITMSAKQSGMSAEVFANMDEKSVGNVFYNAFTTTFPSVNTIGVANELPLSDKLFLLQFDVVKKLANKGACVIVGRCADYMLRDHKNIVSTYIHAPLEFRISRIMRIDKLSHDEAESLISKTDKRRASYYNYYTDRKWAHVTNYNLALDSSRISTAQAADLICAYVALRDSAK